MTDPDGLEKAFPQSRQVGGNHYKNFHIQPYEFISKNKIEDLQKIIHYCELEILKLQDKKKK